MSDEVIPKESNMCGYARVSAKDQNLDRQYDALLDFGVEEENIFADKASGRDFKHPAYKRMMRRLHGWHSTN